MYRTTSRFPVKGGRNKASSCLLLDQLSFKKASRATYYSHQVQVQTRSSATVNSTVRPSCLVGVLYEL